MQIPVLIEPVGSNGFRARGGEPFGLSAEGATAEEAVQKLHAALVDRMATGARIVQIDVPGGDHPWLRFAGMFADDPLFDDWQQAIAERRRQLDEDSSVP
jgi:hypothetical protein